MTIVSKGDFAEACKVDKSAVSHWIRDGHLGGKAIVGSGRFARINLEIALEQLRTRLDVGQRLGNGFGTQLSKATTASKKAVVIRDQPEEGDEAGDGGSDDVDRRLKLSKLEALERANRMAAMEEAATAGTYVDAVETAAEMGRIASTMMQAFTGAMPIFATAVAAKFKLVERDVRHVLDHAMRDFRQQAHEAAAKRASEIPATVPADQLRG